MKRSVVCFRKISVVNNFMHRSGVEYQDFLSKIICLTVQKNSVGGANPLAFHSFRASTKFGQEGGGSIKIFRPKCFV